MKYDIRFAGVISATANAKSFAENYNCFATYYN